MRRLKTLVLGLARGASKTLAIVRHAIIIASIVIGVSFYLSATKKPSIPAKTILTIAVNGALSEQPTSSNAISSALGSQNSSLRDIVDALERGKSDDRVKAAVILIRIDTIPPSQAQEIRQAIKRFRASGKPVYAYADTFGEFSSGLGAYYLAAAADKIWIQPVGMVGITGLVADKMFYGNLAAKYHVQFEYGQREEYKTAMNSYTEADFTPADREETQTLLSATAKRILLDISADRNIDAADPMSLMNAGPYTGQEALDAKLVDCIGYREAPIADLKKRFGADAASMAHDQYLYGAGHPHQTGNARIAAIYVTGQIVRGDYPPQNTMDPSVAADGVARAIETVATRSDLKALVLRIDSPGGSPVASETIRHAILNVKATGKPVIVSMGTLAGSGGYWIAADATRIFAEPTTYTGSIGVYGGKITYGPALEAFGVTASSVSIGDNASMIRQYCHIAIPRGQSANGCLTIFTRASDLGLLMLGICATTKPGRSQKAGFGPGRKPKSDN